MAQSGAHERSALTVLVDECEEIQRLTALVRVAMGRLGGSVSPWLDEGLLMAQGLVTLLEMAEDSGGDAMADEGALGWVVSGMRTWARASSWYCAAWPCRIAPLCSALAEHGSAADRQIAGDLGLDEGRLEERYAEAGLVFGVSPELLLPGRATDARGLSAAISELPRDQRKLLTLYFEDDLSFPEIAELLGMAPLDTQGTYGRAAARIRARVFGGRQMTGVAG